MAPEVIFISKLVSTLCVHASSADRQSANTTRINVNRDASWLVNHCFQAKYQEDIIQCLPKYSHKWIGFFILVYNYPCSYLYL